MGSFKSAKTCAILMVSLLSLSLPVFAQSASDLVTALKSSKAVGSSSVEVAALHSQMIITLSGESNASSDDLHARALTLAKIVAADKANLKPLTILFKDQASNIKEFSFDAAQMTQLATGAEVQIAATQADAAVAVPQTHQLTVTAQATTTDKYQVERAKVVARIEALRAKGVGVTPFVQEISRIDDTYTHGGDALTMISKLDSTLTEQEKNRQEMQKVASTRTVNRMQPAAYNVRGTRTAATSGSDIAVGDYNGSMDGFVSQMINTFVTKEVGQWVPRKGPFMVERLRIARRIHELEGQSVRVDGVGNLYRNMEGVVATQDPRRLGELSMDIKYLQSQLGLSQLEGGLHTHFGI